MKAIILAAGQGARLKPMTNDRPKCMVKYKGKAIINYILDSLYANDITEIAIVTGYHGQKLKKYLATENIIFFENKQFNTTNMVYSLFCATPFMNDDFIITYSDIIYNKAMISNLLASKDKISVIIDKNWRKLWQVRMENPLLDAETLKLDANNNIIEIGLKSKDYTDIEGQYVGLIKVSKCIINDLVCFYYALKKSAQNDLDNLHMTSFIQHLIDKRFHVSASLTTEKWIEIDCLEDLYRYESTNYF